MCKKFGEEENAREERMHVGIGTLNYMAPEVFHKMEFDSLEFQVDPEEPKSLDRRVLRQLGAAGPVGDPNYTYKCDIWSLGVVAYCLLQRCEDSYPFEFSPQDLRTLERDAVYNNLEEVRKQRWRNRITEYRIKSQPLNDTIDNLNGASETLVELTRFMLDRDETNRRDYPDIINVCKTFLL